MNSTEDDTIIPVTPIPLRVPETLVQEVRASLEQESGDSSSLVARIGELHAADVADIIERLKPPEQTQFIQLMGPALDSVTFVELSPPVREAIIAQLPPQEIAYIITALESDDAVAISEGLPLEQQKEVEQFLTRETRLRLKQALQYPEDSAGRLMQYEVVIASDTWTLGQIIDNFEDNPQLPQRFYDVFVVDAHDHPIGFVSLDQLLRYPRRTPVQEILQEDITSIPVMMDREEVGYIFQRYGLSSAPVIASTGEIIGMITVDDVMHVIQEEAEEDILHLGGVSSHTPPLSIVQNSYARLRWLIVSLINTLIAASVISHFEDIIAEVVALAVLMPIVTAMGGNAGMQVVTVTVRALAQYEIQPGQFWQILSREMTIALVNGALLALLIAGTVYFWYRDLQLCYVLAAALYFNILWAAGAGTIFPVFLHRLRLDPAISSGPLLTTTTDVLGFAVFLGIARFVF